MPRSILIPFLLLTLLVTLPGQTSLLPVLPEALPDPYVFKADNEWSVFGTANYFYHGSGLRPYAMKREELKLLYTDAADRPAQGIWGFTPYRHIDGSWHGYATLHYGGFRTAVAHFLPEAGATWRAGHPIARWRFDKILVGDPAAGKTTAYESKIITDKDGALYIVYSASPAAKQNVHIWVQRMLDPGSLDPTWTPRTLLDPEGYRSEDRNPGYIQIVEGANLVKIGPKYALFYSVGDFALNNYKLGVAFSDRLIPPPGQTYRKVLIADPQNIWGNTGKTNEVCYLLQSEQPHWPNYCRSLVSGPGLGNIIASGGEHWLIFHAYKPDDKTRNPDNRHVWALPLRVNIDESRPMQDWLRPDLGEPAAQPPSNPIPLEPHTKASASSAYRNAPPWQTAAIDDNSSPRRASEHIMTKARLETQNPPDSLDPLPSQVPGPDTLCYRFRSGPRQVQARHEVAASLITGIL